MDAKRQADTDRGFRCCVSNYHGLPHLRTLCLEPTPLRGLTTTVRSAAAPVLKCFLYIGLHWSLEARPRYVLDCATVKLHDMKAIPSIGERIPAIGLGTAGSFSRAARPPEECYAR